MSSLRVEATRGGVVESVHQVSCAVADATGRLVADAGHPSAVTWWRSAAKPFQAMPLVEDGAADRWGLGDEELAIACASHSSEPRHLEVVGRLMDRAGIAEEDLACGPHPPLSPAVHRELLRSGRQPTARWSNCSGKHAAMLALARHHGWPLAGYTDPAHPVQQRILRSILQWTALEPGQVAVGVDGCAAPCFGLPLAAMATAWAGFAAAVAPAPARLRAAMLAHPFLVAGTGRPCTEFMQAWPGELIAKIGAEGVYGAALPGAGLGIALKVADGDMRSSALALVAVLRQLAGQAGPGFPTGDAAALEAWIDPPIRNTRETVTGRMQVSGALVFRT